MSNRSRNNSNKARLRGPQTSTKTAPEENQKNRIPQRALQTTLTSAQVIPLVKFWRGSKVGVLLLQNGLVWLFYGLFFSFSSSPQGLTKTGVWEVGESIRFVVLLFRRSPENRFCLKGWVGPMGFGNCL